MTQPTQPKPWMYALVQHPMWLIIAEDFICAERMPPWGCASLEEYAGRLAASLEAVERFPQLHVNFDFSAVELEDVAERYPEIMALMRKLVSDGRISFLNGTYSQPHLQILSVESALRQFDYGLRSIHELTGYRVKCYAAQEPGLTPQLPQILKALGYESSAGPDFPYGIRLIGGQVQHWDKHYEWLAGDDSVDWQAPDGSVIPFWLKSCFRPDEKIVADEHQHGLLGHTRLRVDMPDMVEVTPEWVAEREELCEFVRLDQALGKMASENPDRATAYIDANYAYLEGVDAEELGRANARAESTLLRFEAIQTFCPYDAKFGLDANWKKLLKAQHHDAYWTGAPELRQKSIAWAIEMQSDAEEASARLARELSKGLPMAPEGCEPILILHPYPRKHRVPVEIPTECGVTDAQGEQIPAQQSVNGSTVIVASTEGMGYQTVFATGERKQPARQEMQGAFGFKNKFYSIEADRDGTVKQLAPAGQRNLLAADRGNVWLSGDTQAKLKSSSLVQGPVFDMIESYLRVGPAEMTTRLTFYHDLPWFEVETHLDFSEPTEIGDFFDDRTKLHYSWAIESNRIRHAIGGCAALARRGRSFVVTPWVDAQGETGGLAFCLDPTKCWYADGKLSALAAWGHNGDHFHNRQGPLRDIMGPLNWKRPMDLRLRGDHFVRYAVWPHAGELTDFEIADWAGSLLTPPQAFPMATGGGEAPWSRTYLSIDSPGVLPLSVREHDGSTTLRAMEMEGESHRLDVTSQAGWNVESIAELGGNAVDTISPHRIVEARIGTG